MKTSKNLRAIGMLFIAIGILQAVLTIIILIDWVFDSEHVFEKDMQIFLGISATFSIFMLIVGNVILKNAGPRMKILLISSAKDKGDNDELIEIAKRLGKAEIEFNIEEDKNNFIHSKTLSVEYRKFEFAERICKIYYSKKH